jgi:hypothetical protein
MGQFRRTLFGLCLPPAAAASLDAALTLRGQSAEYWAGKYARVNELSPTFHHLLAYHPLAFVAGFLGWALIFTTVILLLPRTLALAMSLAVTLGHTWGATTWLLHRFHYGYQACEALFVLTALVSALGIDRIWSAEGKAAESVGSRLRPPLRWGLVAVLSGIAGYLFLWPRKPREQIAE